MPSTTLEKTVWNRRESNQHVKEMGIKDQGISHSFIVTGPDLGVSWAAQIEVHIARKDQNQTWNSGQLISSVVMWVIF